MLAFGENNPSEVASSQLTKDVDRKERYFFITSYQRSGSNWLRNCINFSPEVNLSGELKPLGNIYLLEKLTAGDQLSRRRVVESGGHREAIRSAIIQLMKGNFLEEDKKPNTTLLGDKSAYGYTSVKFFSVKKHDHVSKLVEYFPECKQIVLIRDLRDTIVSFAKWPNSHNILSLNPIKLLRFYIFIKSWSKMYEEWLLDSKKYDQCIVIRYEDLKENFEESVNKVYQHLDLEINGDGLEALKEKLYDIKGKFYQEVNKKRGYSFYRSGKVGEWKKELTWIHRWLVKRVATKTLREYGYEI